MPAERVKTFTESVIRGMTRECLKYGGINLAQGFPDFDPPGEIKEAAVRAIRDGYNQYAITWGSPNLRQAIAEKVSSYNGIPADPEQNVVVTCGATEAMIASLLATVNPGEEVIVFEPFYENYGPDAILAGANPRYVSLRGPQLTFDPEELEQAFTPRTRALILNTPHNPTGKVFSREELEIIGRLCCKHNVIAVTDEIYEHILYDEARHVSLATLEGMTERTITISGLSKTYSVTGWRLGYTIACAEITDGIRKVHDFLTVGAPAPLQEAAAVALRLPHSYYQGLQRDYTRRRDLLYGALCEAGFQCTLPQGAYYILTNFEAFDSGDDTEFAMGLVRNVGVAGVPGSSFYHHAELGKGQIRFTFCKREETLRAAAERLHSLPRL